MKDWRNRKGLYMIKETDRKSTIEYPMIATGNEITSFCKSKNECYGYVDGLGGDKNYSCIAWLLEYKD